MQDGLIEYGIMYNVIKENVEYEYIMLRYVKIKNI